VKDTNRPVVKDHYTVKADGSDKKKDTITFYFSEAMDRETATNLSNYIVEEAAGDYEDLKNLNFASIEDVKVKEFAADGKSITFYFPDAGGFANTGEIRVLAIKDLAGNMIQSKVVQKINDVDRVITIKTIKATATNKIEVYFNSPIAKADPSAFKVKKSGVAFSTFSAFEIKNDEENTEYKVIFTLVNALDSSATTNFTLAGNLNNVIENIYGEKLDTSTLDASIDDAIAPYVKEIAAADGKVVNITLSEKVQASTTDAVFNALIIEDPDGNVISQASPTGKLTKIEFIDVIDGSDNVVEPSAGFVKIRLTFANGQVGKEYKISVISRSGSITDYVEPTPLVIKAYEKKAVTIKN